MIVVKATKIRQYTHQYPHNLNMNNRNVTAFAALDRSSQTKSASVKSWIDSKWNAGRDAIQGAKNTAQSAVDNTWNAGADAVNGVKDDVYNGGKAMVDGVTNAAQSAVDNTWNAGANVVNGATKATQNAVDNTWNAGADTVNGVTKAVDNTWNAGADTVNGVTKAVDNTWNAGADVVNGVTNAAQSAVDNTWNAGADAVESAQRIGTNIAGATGNAVKSVGNVAGAVGNAVAAPFRAVDGALAGASKTNGTLGEWGQSIADGTAAGWNGSTGAAAKNMAMAGQHADQATAHTNALTGGGAPTPAGAAPTLAGAAPTPAGAAPQAGPTAAQMQQFQKGTGGSYDPNSWLSRNKMNSMMQGGANWADNSAARAAGNQQYGWNKSASLTPFAALEVDMEKEALARGIGKGLGWLGSKFKGFSSGAKGRAGREAFEELGGKRLKGADGEALKQLTGEAADAAGRRSGAVGKRLQGAEKAIGNSKGLQNAINYGGGAALGGGALYGSNRMGHSSGMETGLENGVNYGYDIGAQAGLQEAMRNQPQDPGFLGRIMDVFTGPQQGASGTDMYGNVQQNKAEILKLLLDGGR